MGVNLTPIIRKRVLRLSDLGGKRLAVDANNYLYQFLSLIRMPDGTPLKDARGNITSHLTGLIFRTTRLMHDFNIRLVFVFDGAPPKLKLEEIRKRRENRGKAVKEWKIALEAGDYKTAFSKAVMTSRLTASMVDDAKRTLDLLGVPHVQAPSEGEAQCAYLARRGDVWAAASKDYDCLLFGALRLIRFLTISGREFLPSKGISRPLKPELIDLHNLLETHNISRRQLIDAAILVGTDFNKGVFRVGPKTALKLMKKHGSLENLPENVKLKLTTKYEEIRRIFLHPKVTAKYSLAYRDVNEDGLYHFLCDMRDFSRRRVETVVNRMKAFHLRREQTDLGRWVSNS